MSSALGKPYKFNKKLKSLTYFSNAQNGIFDFSFHFLCGAIVQVVS